MRENGNSVVKLTTNATPTSVVGFYAESSNSTRRDFRMIALDPDSVDWDAGNAAQLNAGSQSRRKFIREHLPKEGSNPIYPFMFQGAKWKTSMVRHIGNNEYILEIPQAAEGYRAAMIQGVFIPGSCLKFMAELSAVRRYFCA